MAVTAHNPRQGVERRGKLDPRFRPHVERTEAYEVVPGRGAECSDRSDREAWCGTTYKSAYTHLIAIPEVVGPRDVAEAHRIHERILQCIERGGWTGNEWNRLHRLERAWRLRAAGQDVAFNLRGWKRKHTGHHTPGVEKFMSQVRGALNVEISD